MLKKLQNKFAIKPKKKPVPQNAEVYDKTVIGWEAPEYIKHEKGKTWFTVAGIIILLLVLWGLYTDSWSTAVVFLLLGGVYYLSHTHTPSRIKITISEIGIKVGENYYPYSHIKAFWMHYHPPFVKTLNFRTLDRFFKEVTIQLDGQDPVPIRTYLARQIPEWEGKEESLIDILTRIFKL